MRPSPTLVPRLTPILRAQPQLPAYTALPRRDWSRSTQNTVVETQTQTQQPTPPPTLPSIPMTSSPTFLNTRHSTFFPSPTANSVPPPTLAWCDFLSMV